MHEKGLSSLRVVLIVLWGGTQAAGFIGGVPLFPGSTAPRCRGCPLQESSILRATLESSVSGGSSGCSRRQVLRSSAGVGLGIRLLDVPFADASVGDADDEDETPAPASASAGAKGLPKLASRFAKGQVKSLGPAGPLGPPDVAAPDWLEGTWSVTYTLQQAVFPLTKDFAQFKQLLAGSVRSPSDTPGEDTTMTQTWAVGEKGAEEDKVANLKSYYNAFAKDLTIESSKGSRIRKVAWMPILTQRGIYEKVNSVTVSDKNNFRMVVKEIAPDLTVVGTAPIEGVVVNRKGESSADGAAFIITELYRIKRLSQGKVKMVETGTGDTEVVTAYIKKGDNEIVGKHRVLVYLVPFPGPAGDKYADSAGGAIAVYDYSMTMTREQE